ncbi:hypothetical protein AB1Y20_015646 [Prymnesium parvum]|uniref:Uncharacterized protein n=1 Tax=Prymnesium parvum TaxID=97485 RepID=A0AB34K0T6_PRYPA
MSVEGMEDTRCGRDDEGDDEGDNARDEHDQGNDQEAAAHHEADDDVQPGVVEGEVVPTNETERMAPEREGDQFEEEEEELTLAISIPHRVPWPLPPAPSDTAATVCLRRDDPSIAAHKALLLVDAPKNEVHSIALKEPEKIVKSIVMQ